MVFKHPTVVHVSAGVQREVPLGFVMDVTYVGRRGLYLQRERNINQLQAGTLQANPASTSPRCAPTRATASSAWRECRLLEVQQPPAERRSPLHEGLQVRPRVHARQVGGQRQRQANVMWNTYDDSELSGARRASTAATCWIYYIYDLPFWQDATRCADRPGGWQISGRTFMRIGHAVLDHPHRRHRRCRRSIHAAGQLVGDLNANANAVLKLVGRRDRPELLVQSRRRSPAGGRHVRQRDAQQLSTRATCSGTSRCSRMSASRERSVAVARGGLQLPESPEPERRSSDPTNANFGRVTGKDDSRRDVQLSIRFLF